MNKSQIKGKSIERLLNGVAIISLMIATLTSQESYALKLTGRGALVFGVSLITLGAAVIVFKRRKIPKSDFLVFVLFISFASVYLLKAIGFGQYDYIINALQIVITAAGFFYFLYACSDNGLAWMRWVQTAIVVLVLGAALLVIASGGGFTLGFGNKNVLGIFLYVGAMYSVVTLDLSKAKSRVAVFAYFMLVSLALLALSARASVLVLVSSWLLLLFWPKISKERWRLWLITFTFFVAVGLMISSVYSSGVEAVKGLEMVSEDVFGKRLESGRDKIWPLVLDEVKKSPAWGATSSSDLEYVIGDKLSAHNLFVQILFQVGAIGLISFMALIFTVLGMLRSNGNNVGLNVAGAALFGGLIFQCFEVFMFQNNFIYGFLIWCLVGMVIGEVRYKKLMHN